MKKYDVPTACKWGYKILKLLRIGPGKKTCWWIFQSFTHQVKEKHLFSHRHLFVHSLACLFFHNSLACQNNKKFFSVPILSFCKTQFILMAWVLYKQMLNDSVIYTSGFFDKICSFNRCFYWNQKHSALYVQFAHHSCRYGHVTTFSEHFTISSLCILILPLGSWTLNHRNIHTIYISPFFSSNVNAQNYSFPIGI